MSCSQEYIRTYSPSFYNSTSGTVLLLRISERRKPVPERKFRKSETKSKKSTNVELQPVLEIESIALHYVCAV